MRCVANPVKGNFYEGKKTYDEGGELLGGGVGTEVGEGGGEVFGEEGVEELLFCC